MKEIDRKIVLVLAHLMPELQRGLVNENVGRINLKHFHFNAHIFERLLLTEIEIQSKVERQFWFPQQNVVMLVKFTERVFASLSDFILMVPFVSIRIESCLRS